MNAEYKTELAPVTEDTANEPQAAVLAAAKAAVGFIPNMYGGMVNSPGLLETYLDGYGRFRRSGRFTPQEQETIFLVLSRENGCTYCVTAHSMIAAKKSGVSDDALAAIREGREIPEPKLEAVARFTAHRLGPGCVMTYIARPHIFRCRCENVEHDLISLNIIR